MEQEFKHRNCENCSEHKVLEEKMKILDRIPLLLSWMNVTKGVMLILTAFLVLLSTNINSTKSELNEKQKSHEVLIKEQQQKMSEQVTSICRDVSAIERNVAVMVNTFELSQKEAAKERLENTRRIERLERKLDSK